MQTKSMASWACGRSIVSIIICICSSSVRSKTDPTQPKRSYRKCSLLGLAHLDTKFDIEVVFQTLQFHCVYGRPAVPGAGCSPPRRKWLNMTVPSPTILVSSNMLRRYCLVVDYPGILGTRQLEVLWTVAWCPPNNASMYWKITMFDKWPESPNFRPVPTCHAYAIVKEVSILRSNGARAHNWLHIWRTFTYVGRRCYPEKTIRVDPSAWRFSY